MPYRGYISEASTWWFWRRPRSPTSIIFTEGWYMEWFDWYEHNGGGRRTSRSMTSRPGPTPVLECRVNALPQGKCGDMWCRHQLQMDPDHRHIPPALHLGTLTGLGGVPENIPGPRSHIVGGTQHWYRKILEPAQPACCWPADLVWDDGPPPTLPEALTVPESEYGALGETGKSDMGK